MTATPQTQTYIPPGETPKVRTNPLRQWRVENSVSQTEIATRLGISSGYVYKLELGTRLPSAATMERLIQATGVANLPTLWHRWTIDTEA